MWKICTPEHEIILWDDEESERCPLCRANMLILDLFRQACWLAEAGNYDHMDLYQEAQAYLIDHGLIRAEECVRGA